jgi:acetyl esterase/lipase
VTALLTWADLESRRALGAGRRFVYADQDRQQFCVLRVPDGAGPHPVAVIVHGGCWLAEYDCRHVEPMAEALTARGLATWVVEYRRVGHAGGGWPGTFVDVARGHAALRVVAPEHALDLSRVVVVGHSAGAHLALWLAARAVPDPGFEIHLSDKLPVSAVVSLAGITDLRGYRLGSGSCNAAVALVMGGSPEERPQRYAATNPLDLVPIGVPMTLIHGAADDLVLPEQARVLADAEARAGGDVRLVLLPDAGHFDLVAPFSTAWPAVEAEILRAIRATLAPDRDPGGTRKNEEDR